MKKEAKTQPKDSAKEFGVPVVEKKGDDSLEKKLKKVDESKMPDWQKEQYKSELKAQAGVVDEKAKKISFAVYANMKKIPEHVREGMRSYPSAKGLTSATFAEWEEVYKQF